MKKYIIFIVLLILLGILVVIGINEEEYKIKDRCSQRMIAYGNCDMLIRGYFYDKASGSCIQGTVGGCSADIPFKNLSECQETCGNYSSLRKLCENTGGVYRDRSDFEGFMDPGPFTCICPDNKEWDNSKGCVENEPFEKVPKTENKSVNYECSNNSDCAFVCGKGCMNSSQALLVEPTDVQCPQTKGCECQESLCVQIN